MSTMDDLIKAFNEEESYFYVMKQEFDKGIIFINTLKKYKGKKIKIKKLEKLFNKYKYDFSLFLEEYYNNLYQGCLTGGCDIIVLEECYIGFTFDILPKDKLIIKGFYKDS